MGNSETERPTHVKPYFLLSDVGVFASVLSGSTVDLHLRDLTTTWDVCSMLMILFSICLLLIPYVIYLCFSVWRFFMHSRSRQNREQFKKIYFRSRLKPDLK